MQIILIIFQIGLIVFSVVRFQAKKCSLKYLLAMVIINAWAIGLNTAILFF